MISFYIDKLNKGVFHQEVYQSSLPYRVSMLIQVLMYCSDSLQTRWLDNSSWYSPSKINISRFSICICMLCMLNNNKFINIVVYFSPFNFQLIFLFETRAPMGPGLLTWILVSRRGCLPQNINPILQHLSPSWVLLRS